MEMTDINKDSGHPYIVEYLEPLIKVHYLVFEKIAAQKEYDAFSMMDAYMLFSEIRQRMDAGNWSALNKGWKQIFNDIPKDKCEKYHGQEPDDILAHWMAHIYVLFQWLYNIPSNEICRRIPAKELSHIYNPLHEVSEKTACQKLLHKYFPDKENDYDQQIQG